MRRASLNMKAESNLAVLSIIVLVALIMVTFSASSFVDIIFKAQIQTFQVFMVVLAVFIFAAIGVFTLAKRRL